MNALSTALLDRTPRQALNALEEGMGLSEEELAQALGTSRRTLQRWRMGTAYPQQATRQRLSALLELQQRVRPYQGAHRWAALEHIGSTAVPGCDGNGMMIVVGPEQRPAPSNPYKLVDDMPSRHCRRTYPQRRAKESNIQPL